MVCGIPYAYAYACVYAGNCKFRVFRVFCNLWKSHDRPGCNWLANTVWRMVARFRVVLRVGFLCAGKAKQSE